MRNKLAGWRSFVRGAVSVMLTLSLTCAAYAQQPLTPRSVNDALDKMKLTYEVKNFKIGGKYDLANATSFENGAEGGTTLESLGAGPARTAYIAVGTPKKNNKGEIINAIVINSYYSGDATAMYTNWYAGQAGNAFSGGALVGPGLLFDTDRFYVVFVDALGLWGASKPSDGLGMKFPVYSYYDVVQLNYRLLRDKLNIGQVVLATGASMGGTQAYYWGLMYPGFVKAVMPIGGASATDGEGPVAAWTFQLAKAALESDPVWVETKGDYYKLPKDQHPNKGVEFHWSMLSLTGYQLNYRQSLGWEAVSKEVFTWKDDPRMGKDAGANLKRLASQFDGVDLWYRDTVGEIHNINKLLPGMKARTLVVHIDNDQWLISDKAKEAAQLIPGGQYVGFPDKTAHYAVFKAPNSLKTNPIFDTFMRDIGVISDKTIVCEAKNYRSPKINMKPDPNKSFWKDEMVSPFPVKYAKVKDKRGVEWEIGYMDEYCGKASNPPTLVVVHGKGAFGAHYGYLIKYAVERGYRVIAPDMPQWGMSGPGNIDKPMTRTLNDVRDAFHALVVGKLGVNKAFYHGHSLGGQTVIGYAMLYPNAVQGLILEGPAGLEEYPKSIEMNGKSYPICDPSIAYDLKAWNAAYEPMGLVSSEINKTPQAVEDFFYFRKRDAAGNVTASPAGYFFNDTEYARLHTNQRIAMMTGNKREFEQWAFMFTYDLYSICSENVKEDPNSIYKRLPTIKAPIFLTFGAKEPFIPGTALNGLTDMAKTIVIPFKQRMTFAGNPPTIKIYPNVGHFIHTDVPYEFAKDTVDFMRSGKVDLMSADVIEALINPVGEGAAAPAAASSGKPSGLAK
ncbi:MAG: alpha/beta hydrolase [Candidatus Accumulibacter phosphatis]|uniref:Alpha/beta hydrolase n=1 Tax=Candidatus Accumulibacter phosphatis TaxID=327160 RepID=A0A6A7RWC6_9PROT|nr:alpha/beta hydrolase [Candidatus Accumulibacter phosphatis]